jgi:hypothetical protein
MLLRPSLFLACALLFASTGCRSAQIERSRAPAWARLSDVQARLHPFVWGTRIPAETVAANRRKFDCIWDATVRAGNDPRGDAECLVRQLDSMVVCRRGREAGQTCLERSRTVCPLSEDFRRGDRACRASLHLR